MGNPASVSHGVIATDELAQQFDAITKQATILAGVVQPLGGSLEQTAPRTDFGSDLAINVLSQATGGFGCTAGDWLSGQLSDGYISFANVQMPAGANVTKATLRYVHRGWLSTQDATLRGHLAADSPVPSPADYAGTAPSNWAAETVESYTMPQSAAWGVYSDHDITAIVQEIMTADDYGWQKGNGMGFRFTVSPASAGNGHYLGGDPGQEPILLLEWENGRQLFEAGPWVNGGKTVWIHAWDAADLEANRQRSFSDGVQYSQAAAEYIQENDPNKGLTWVNEPDSFSIEVTRGETEVTGTRNAEVWGGVVADPPPLNFSTGWPIDVNNKSYLMMGVQWYVAGAPFYLIWDLLGTQGFRWFIAENEAMCCTNRAAQTGNTSGGKCSFQFGAGSAAKAPDDNKVLAWETAAARRTVEDEAHAAYSYWNHVTETVHWGYNPGNGVWETGSEAYAISANPDPFSVIGGWRYNTGERRIFECCLEFDSLPADIDAGAQWMAKYSPLGIKMVYPGWRP